MFHVLTEDSYYTGAVEKCNTGLVVLTQQKSDKFWGTCLSKVRIVRSLMVSGLGLFT